MKSTQQISPSSMKHTLESALLKIRILTLQRDFWRRKARGQSSQAIRKAAWRKGNPEKYQAELKRNRLYRAKRKLNVSPIV